MTERFDAWWLPGIDGTGERDTLVAGELECSYPVPTPDLVERSIRSLRSAGPALVARPVAEIVSAIDVVAGRFLDPADPLRRDAERLLTAATGYSNEMTRLVLDRMAADWRAEPIRDLLQAELSEPAALDGYTRVVGGWWKRAYGPKLAFNVFAGNVPGVAVTALIRCLLVKAPTLGKLASGQPVLPVLFARALHEVDPALGSAVALSYWPGGSDDAEGRAIEAADTIVIYGGADTVASLRERVPPDHRLVVHGPRYSAGLVGQEALDDPDLPDLVARAVATFDQHGCVSPHAVWVEDPTATGSEPFAQAVAEAFSRLEAELPRGQITAAEAAAIHQERGAAEMRGYEGAVRVIRPDTTAWTVVLDREPVFRPSCLNRFIHVYPIDSLEKVPDLLAPIGAQIQSVAVAASDERRFLLAEKLARIGATRITSFERLPWPPAHWHHDGRGPLHELLRWVDLED